MGDDLRRGDLVRDRRRPEVIGRVVQPIPPLPPRVFVEWQGDDGLPGPVAAHFESDLELVQRAGGVEVLPGDGQSG